MIKFVDNPGKYHGAINQNDRKRIYLDDTWVIPSTSENKIHIQTQSKGINSVNLYII